MSKITKIDLAKDTYHNFSNNIIKSRETNLPLNGKFEALNGDIYNFKDGKLHSENGSAYISKLSGYEEYFFNGKKHRLDGPSLIYYDGGEYWYINGENVSTLTMNNWLEENDISLDHKTWTNEDKAKFATHWSDYNC